MDIDLPYSQACENNKAPILAVLTKAFASRQKIVEIGSGTGQHAVYFAEQLTHLTWQASDQAAYLPELNQRITRANRPNLPAAICLDVNQSAWPATHYDGLFTANTLHIMNWEQVQRFFVHLNTVLTPSATLCIYGPFNYQGQFTSVSNQVFDAHLKTRDPLMGIRDSEQIIALALQQGFNLLDDITMPANNRLLWFTRQ